MDEGAERMGGTRGRVLASAAVQALACLALPASALAQVQPQPSSPSAQAQPAAKPASRPARKPAAESEKQDDPTVVSEVVINVSAAPYRIQPGAVVGDIEPEVQLSPADIQSYGVSTLTELLTELAPQTNSNQGRGGETPVVLLNGKRISGFQEVRDIPTEAILRVDILPEEVALKYGFTADQKVVNFVLRQRFRSTTHEVTGDGPTAGGGDVSGQYEGDRFQVRGDNRFNLDVKINGNTDLPYASRGLTGASNGAPYALMGNIVSATGRGPIDPALSAVAGQPLTVVGVPASAANMTPSLAAFAATPANVDNIGRYRDLVGEAQSLSVNMVIARALGSGYSTTFNVAFTGSSGQSMQGLPDLKLIVPAGSPYSPFSSNVTLDRYVNALGALNQDSSGWTGHFGATLNKVDAGRWRFNLTTAYDHNDSLTETQAGIDQTGLQNDLNAGSSAFNPYGAILSSMLTRLPNSEARSISDSANVQGVAYGSLLKVPAGDLNASIKIGDTQSNLTSASFRLDQLQTVELTRNDANVQMNLDMALTSRRRNFLPWMGELTVNANASNDWVSGFGVVKKLGYGLNWEPIPAVRLLVSHTHDEMAPSVSQLGGPTVQTPNVIAYDYVTGQTVNITTLTGGNPTLTGDSRNVFKVGLTLKPWSSQEFTVTANYTDQRLDHPIGSFPAATAAIEAAFPAQFVRDAAGDLTEEDERPINFDWTRRQSLRWGFNLSHQIGKTPPRPVRPPAP